MGKRNKGNRKITRRRFIKTIGAASVAAIGTSFLPQRVFAERDYILIGFPTPVTGPLAPFGETSVWASKRACEEINRGGGIYIGEIGKRLPVKVKLLDTESDPNKAAELASRLIMKDKVDLMVVLHTPVTVNPVSAICERFKVPCIASDDPVETWLSGGPYHWTFNFFWTVPQSVNVHIGIEDMVADKTNKIIGFLWPNDPDGVVASQVWPRFYKERGYKVVDTGRYPSGMQDFSSVINTLKKENAEILDGVPTPPDWATFWRQCHQQGYVPKIATIAKAILFPSAVSAIGGDLPHGLTTDVWWTPMHPFKSSLTGYSCRELAEAWTRDTKQQWTQPLGYDYAVFEVAADVLKRAGSLDKAKIREALAQTDIDTMVGHVKFNERNFSPTPLVGGQWVKGKRWPWELQIIYNRDFPEIPVTGEIIFPLPR
ncbi:MAG: ABC transporter substrate-binding protein [Deltaproteobacteria bacterium]|nr:ABC transporter substrate-binding protein [Deltaproteobacteria bacterium]